MISTIITYILYTIMLIVLGCCIYYAIDDGNYEAGIIFAICWIISMSYFFIHFLNLGYNIL